MRLTLGALLVRATGSTPPQGRIAGACVICGEWTARGLRLQDCVSGNFSGWNRFYHGDCLCPPCAFIFADQAFRKRSWVASAAAGLQFLTGDGTDRRLATLLDPPEPPFFLYLCRIGHRQGWLSCLHRVAVARDRYWFAHEDFDVPVRFERQRAEAYVALIHRARRLKVTRAELRAGLLRSGSCRRALEAGEHRLPAELAAAKGDPLWEVMVHVVPADAGGRGAASGAAGSLL